MLVILSIYLGTDRGPFIYWFRYACIVVSQSLTLGISQYKNAFFTTIHCKRSLSNHKLFSIMAIDSLSPSHRNDANVLRSVCKWPLKSSFMRLNFVSLNSPLIITVCYDVSWCLCGICFDKFLSLIFSEFIGVFVHIHQLYIVNSGYICYGEEFLYRSLVIFQLWNCLQMQILFTNTNISVVMKVIIFR